MIRYATSGMKVAGKTAGLICVALAAGCLGSRTRAVLPDDQFGHRYEMSQGGRVTLELPVRDTTAGEYFYYPAVVESLHVRHAPFDLALPVEAQQVAVEMLVKGVLPDNCSQLYQIEQWRAGHILHVTFEMRRPVGAVCDRIGQPFRFYTRLEGTYEAGDYIIKLNSDVFPFVLQPPPS